MNVKTVEVLVSASIREKEVNAKTVEVLVYASIRDEEVNAKTAGFSFFKCILLSIYCFKFISIAKRYMQNLLDIHLFLLTVEVLFGLALLLIDFNHVYRQHICSKTHHISPTYMSSV